MAFAQTYQTNSQMFVRAVRNSFGTVAHNFVFRLSGFHRLAYFAYEITSTLHAPLAIAHSSTENWEVKKKKISNIRLLMQWTQRTATHTHTCSSVQCCYSLLLFPSDSTPNANRECRKCNDAQHFCISYLLAATKILLGTSAALRRCRAEEHVDFLFFFVFFFAFTTLFEHAFRAVSFLYNFRGFFVRCGWSPFISECIHRIHGKLSAFRMRTHCLNMQRDGRKVRFGEATTNVCVTTNCNRQWDEAPIGSDANGNRRGWNRIPMSSSASPSTRYPFDLKCASNLPILVRNVRTELLLIYYCA